MRSMLRALDASHASPASFASKQGVTWAFTWTAGAEFPLEGEVPMRKTQHLRHLTGARGERPADATGPTRSRRGRAAAPKRHHPNGAFPLCARLPKRACAPWKTTGTVAVGPFLCFATMMSASPGRSSSS